MPVTAFHIAALIAVLELVAFGSTFLDDIAMRPERSVPFGIIWAKGLYFTVLTNGLVGVAFAHKAWTRRVWSDGWLAALTLWMLIVMVVFHTLLAEPTERTTLDSIANTLYHTVCPLLVAGWWVAYAPKGGLGWRMAGIWLAWPLAYLVYAVGRGMASGTYPYFFLDLDKLGWNGLAMWSLGFLVAFFAAGLAVVGIGKAAHRVTARKG